MLGKVALQMGVHLMAYSHVSMTQDVYMSRGRIHPQVSDLLDRAVISAE